MQAIIIKKKKRTQIRNWNIFYHHDWITVQFMELVTEVSMSKIIESEIRKFSDSAREKEKKKNTHLRGGGLQSIPRGSGEVPSCLCFGGLRLCILWSFFISLSLFLKFIYAISWRWWWWTFINILLLFLWKNWNFLMGFCDC